MLAGRSNICRVVTLWGSFERELPSLSSWNWRAWTSGILDYKHDEVTHGLGSLVNPILSQVPEV